MQHSSAVHWSRTLQSLADACEIAVTGGTFNNAQVALCCTVLQEHDAISQYFPAQCSAVAAQSSRVQRNAAEHNFLLCIMLWRFIEVRSALARRQLECSLHGKTAMYYCTVSTNTGQFPVWLGIVQYSAVLYCTVIAHSPSDRSRSHFRTAQYSTVL